MIRHFVSLTMVAFAMTACANRPESIRASHVSHEKYLHHDCSVLAIKMTDARVELAKVSEQQNDKANGDAVGVFLLLVPFSKLTGDHEADVARWKGEVEAIDTAQVVRKCK